MCQQTTDRIKRLADQLQADIARNRFKRSVKIVLNQEAIAALVVKLQHNISDLQITYMMYMDARRCEENESIKRCMEEGNE